MNDGGVRTIAGAFLGLAVTGFAAADQPGRAWPEKYPAPLAQAGAPRAAPSPLRGEQANARAGIRSLGWYAGGSIGYGGFDADYERTKGTLFSTGATSFFISADAKEVMGKLYAGYKFTPNVSLEAGYWYFGKPGYTANISAPAATTAQRSFRADGFGGHLVFWLPFRNEYAGFAKIGAIRTHVRASALEPGGGLAALPAESSWSLNYSLGLGLEYRLSRNLAGRLEYETVRRVGDDAKFGTADVIMWSLGANYRF